MLINKQTRTLHDDEGNQTTRKGTRPEPPRWLVDARTRLAHYDELPEVQDRPDGGRSGVHADLAQRDFTLVSQKSTPA